MFKHSEYYYRMGWDKEGNNPFEELSDNDLFHQRYLSGNEARRGNVSGMSEVITLNRIIRERGLG